MRGGGGGVLAEREKGVYDLVIAPSGAVEYVSLPFAPFVTFADVGVGIPGLGADDAEPAGKVGVCKAASTAFSVVCLPCSHPGNFMNSSKSVTGLLVSLQQLQLFRPS